MIDAIFIVGTGRSGTHFLCRTLKGFQNIDDYQNGKENLDILYRITNLALSHNVLPNDIIQYYKTKINKANLENKIFLDQHHPNLFHVNQLIKEFPNVLFLATDRPTEQIIASMLNHDGVRSWAENTSKSYVYPNQFLGVDTQDELLSESHILCAKRVYAHNIQREKLIKKYPKNVKRILFTELVNNQYLHLKTVLGDKIKDLGPYREIEKPDNRTLVKYKSIINESMINDIAS